MSKNYGVAILAERERDTWATDDANVLTDRQAEIYQRIYSHTKRHGYQPSLRELAVEFGLSGPHAIKAHLAALVRKGYCEPAAGESRAIRFLRRPDGSKFDGFRD